MTELKTLSEKIIKTDLDGTPIETAVIYKEDVKEFVKIICAGMNCKWKVDFIKEKAGKELI